MIRIRYPAWIMRVPWRWIIVAKIVIGFALWYWLAWHGLVTEFQDNVRKLEGVASQGGWYQ
jgi:hypothetical protein